MQCHPVIAALLSVLTDPARDSWGPYETICISNIRASVLERPSDDILTSLRTSCTTCSDAVRVRTFVAMGLLAMQFPSSEKACAAAAELQGRYLFGRKVRVDALKGFPDDPEMCQQVAKEIDPSHVHVITENDEERLGQSLAFSKFVNGETNERRAMELCIKESCLRASHCLDDPIDSEVAWAGVMAPNENANADEAN